MKKYFLFLSLFLCLTSHAWSQTATSVANGNWYNPTTWNCTCIPTAAYTITINHNVVLDNDFALNGGSITIGPNGVLRESIAGRNLVMNAGTIDNNGKIKISRVGFYSGDFTNNDSCLIYSVFYSGAYVWNSGSISEVDSMFIQSYFYNDVPGTVDAFRVTVNDTLENDGIFNATDLLNLDVFYNNNSATFHNFYSDFLTENYNSITFTDFTNVGEFYNYGFMVGAADATNKGYYYNDTIGTFNVDNDFSNVDSTNHLAYFENEGSVYIHGNFYNRDTIEGYNGNFCVGQASTNAGILLGSFNFYDISNGGPFNLNTGTISNGITYNVYPCTPGGTNLETPVSLLSVYPNPTNNDVNFEFREAPANAMICISDVLGNIVWKQSVLNSKLLTFSKGNLPSGLYIYQIQTESQHISGKIIVE